jgi:hypothetical protein
MQPTNLDSYFLQPRPYPERLSLIIPVYNTVLISFLGGATLISIGVLGQYVGKLYEQTKNRPLFIVSQTINVESSQRSEPRTHVRVD